jgi:Fe2+ transport system protein B
VSIFTGLFAKEAVIGTLNGLYEQGDAAATGVVFREIGKGYGTVFVAYLTVVGWSVATVYNAVMVTGSAFWAFIGSGILVAMFGGFYLYGRKHKVDMV